MTLTRTYDAWGNLDAASATVGGPAFTGREWDPETGLYYYRARYYEPKLGTFVSEDPIGMDGGINFYIYANDSPAVWIDPMGLQVTTNKPPATPPWGGHTGTNIPSGLGGLALSCIRNCIGSSFTISGGSECTPQGTHIPGGAAGSKHCTNQAFDVPTSEVNRTGQNRFFCCAKKCGVQFILDEGSWFHFQLVPGRNGARGRLPKDEECRPPCQY